MKVRLLFASMVCIFSAISAIDAHAETHALLIGVSNYPSLSQSKRLRGPANDVQIMRASLLQSGVANSEITTLADGVFIPSAKPNQVGKHETIPTKQNIIANLRALAQRVKPGDWVIVYFSGHGSQQRQPALNKLPAGPFLEPGGVD